MKAFLKELKNYPIIILFFSFLVIYFFLDLFTPDKAFDDLLNKPLAQKPAFSVEKLVSNVYTKDYEKYLKEQFALKNGWVTMKGRVESLMLKSENNGVIYGDDAYQFTKLYGFDPEQLGENVQAIYDFSVRHPDKVSFMLAPSSSLVLEDKLPTSTHYVDENGFTDDILSTLGETANIIDVRPTLLEHSDEYVYYRTDHHWTTLGAYYAYLEFIEPKGFTPFDLEANNPTEVADFYGTTYSKSLWHKTEPDILTYYDIDNPMQIFDAGKEPVTSTMYNKEKLETRDKYASFIYSNNAFSTIEGDGEGKILVIKDSYGNSLVPFLTANYAQIDVVDLRALKGNVETFITENEYDDILVLYNFQTFITEDPKVFYLNHKA